MIGQNIDIDLADLKFARTLEIIRDANKDFDGNQLQAKLLLDWPVKTDKSVYHPETIRLYEEFRESTKTDPSLKQGS